MKKANDGLYAIKNTATGAFILDNLMSVKKFKSWGSAVAYIDKNNLNRRIYQPVVILDLHSKLKL